jgi:cysteine desulfurase
MGRITNSLIYLDYMATTPVHPQVAAAMQACLTSDGIFANPASDHLFGLQANVAVEQARDQVAAAIGASPAEIIWTSGATEANNLALKGIAQAYVGKKNHIISCATEHAAVLAPLAWLTQQGFRVTLLKPQRNGLLELSALAAALDDSTLLVSIMHVNNETGVIQDIAAISELVHQRGALLHVDAAQSIGKCTVDVAAWQVDALSLSAHKSYGPKGIGALYCRRQPKCPLLAQMHGGAQEHGLRSGTLATHQIVGMGEAFFLATQLQQQEGARLRLLRDQLWQGLQALPGVYLNGSPEQRVVHNLNVSIAGVDGHALRVALRDLGISSGSACHTTAWEPSHVLLAMGVTPVLAHSAIRFSLGLYTTSDHIDTTVQRVIEQVSRLRELSPLELVEENNVAE